MGQPAAITLDDQNTRIFHEALLCADQCGQLARRVDAVAIPGDPTELREAAECLRQAATFLTAAWVNHITVYDKAAE